MRLVSWTQRERGSVGSGLGKDKDVRTMSSCILAPLPRPSQEGCARDSNLRRSGRLPMLRSSLPPVDSTLSVKGPANCITGSSPLKFLVYSPNGIDSFSQLRHAHLCPSEDSAPGARLQGRPWLRVLLGCSLTGASCCPGLVPRGSSLLPTSRLHPIDRYHLCSSFSRFGGGDGDKLAKGPGLLPGRRSPELTGVHGGVRRRYNCTHD